MEPPLTVEAYLQESGRAGRDRKQAEAVLMVSRKDIPNNSPENIEEDTIMTNSRYRNFITTVIDNSSCRRKSLLSLL